MVEHTTARGDPYWANTFPMGRLCLEPVAAHMCGMKARSACRSAVLRKVP
jgi:hypothetical protein